MEFLDFDWAIFEIERCSQALRELGFGLETIEKLISLCQDEAFTRTERHAFTFRLGVYVSYLKGACPLNIPQHKLNWQKIRERAGIYRKGNLYAYLTTLRCKLRDRVDEFTSQELDILNALLFHDHQGKHLISPEK